MKPHEPEPYTNGDGAGAGEGAGQGAGEGAGQGAGEGAGAGCGSGSDGSGSEEAADELSLEDGGWPARALAALNALRKSRQHYDVVLVAGGGDGGEVAAHRAVLGAASPHLLRELAAVAGGGAHRVPDVAAAPLRALVEYAYTGRLAVRSAAEGRALYAAAARLRVEAARAHLAERLLRAARPHSALLLRALPDLEPHHRRALDRYLADHFEEVCSSGALAALPEIRIEMMRASSSQGGREAPHAVAEAALAWLLERAPPDMDELCARAHLVYVDERGALRDCGELPAASGDAPELLRYRRAAELRPPPDAAERRLDGGVVAARRCAGGGTRALVTLRGRAAGVRLAWSDVAAGGGGVARGGALGGAPAAAERRASLAAGRAALGAAALGARLLVCGGYDRARVLRSTEAYDPATNAWTPLVDMRSARARFPAAVLGGAVWVVGGSDGHADLDSVDSYSEARGWEARARLPAAVAHAAAAADEARGELYVVGGWCGGTVSKRALRYRAAAGEWAEAPALGGARAQCAAVWWRGGVWALGGCDAWRCLASTERLARGAAAWEPGPALPTARRSVGGAVWRGRLVSAGGSDGAASLRRVEWLEAGEGEGGWRAGPPLRRARAALGLAVLGEALYAVGGFDGAEFLSCVEVLPAPDAQWTRLVAPPPPPPPRPAAERQEQRENGEQTSQ